VALSTNYFYYRQDAAKRQTAGNKFTHRPKMRFFVPQHAKFGEIELWVPAVVAKIGIFVCHAWSACARGDIVQTSIV